MTKRNTLESFIIKAQYVHGTLYNYSKVNYVNANTKVIIICPVHGEFEQRASSHTQGYGCNKCGTLLQKQKITGSIEEFIAKAKEIHGDKYDYSKAIFNGKLNNITITCPVHGDFEQNASNHIRGGNCPNCSTIKSSEKRTMPWEICLKQFFKIHGNKYDYSKANYIKTTAKIEIICPEHGSFWQSPTSHKQGNGCPKCNVASVWRYTDWEQAGIKSVRFTGFKLYVIECWSDTERFIKIGKTYTNISKRFKSKFLMPYQWKILYSIEGSAKYISEYETKLHNKFKDSKIIPDNPFGGRYECFATSIKENLDSMFKHRY